jgi:hypothetical protein
MSIVHSHSASVLKHRGPGDRMPGQYARARFLRLSLRTLAILGVLAVVTTLLGRTLGLRSPLFIGSELALLIAMFVVVRYVLPLVQRHDRGAAGEEHVGGLLDELTASRWSVIHDASFGRGNVDHIVLGAAGLFSVETKSHPGPVRVRAIHGGVLRQAQEQRETLEEIAGERVEPLVVYSRAWVDKPLSRRRGVRVMPARMLPGYLTRHNHTLTPERVEQIRGRIVAALAEREPAPDRLVVWPPPSRSRS